MLRKTDHRRSHRIGAAAFAGALCLFAPHSPARAASLDFKATPLDEAIARIDKTFDVTLDVRKGVNLRRTVTFSVANVGDDGARLETVNSLANAVKADYRKVFVITQVTGGMPSPDPVIDAADAPVVFDSATIPADKAIETVAGVDDATAQLPSPLPAVVTFSGKKLTAQEAATQIAHQTHTVWKVAYILTPHTDQSSSPGKIIGYTGGGQPIVELPEITFRKPKPTGLEGPTPEQMQDPVFRSAFMRGDRSAMMKFQNGSTPGNQPVSPDGHTPLPISGKAPGN